MASSQETGQDECFVSFVLYFRSDFTDFLIGVYIAVVLTDEENEYLKRIFTVLFQDRIHLKFKEKINKFMAKKRSKQFRKE